PNARRIGFTGTPINFSGADTVQVFGEVIHTYDIKQSQDDHATVPIFYAARQVRLHLSKGDVNSALQEITDQHVVTDLEKRKSQWAALAKAAGAKERVDEVAKDLLAHFTDRSATLKGKAMVVCMADVIVNYLGNHNEFRSHGRRVSAETLRNMGAKVYDITAD